MLATLQERTRETGHRADTEKRAETSLEAFLDSRVGDNAVGDGNEDCAIVDHWNDDRRLDGIWNYDVDTRLSWADMGTPDASRYRDGPTDDGKPEDEENRDDESVPMPDCLHTQEEQPRGRTLSGDEKDAESDLECLTVANIPNCGVGS